MNSDAWSGIAQTILDGFDRHYALFREYGRAGRDCFEHADWKKAAEANLERIQGYERRVRETVEALGKAYPDAARETASWPRIKTAYTGKLMNHWQAECAETFYNSVACRVLHRDYYNSEYICKARFFVILKNRGSQPMFNCGPHYLFLHCLV